MGGCEPQFPDDFVYKCVDVADIPSENIRSSFNDVSKFICSALNRGGNVLIYSWSGISRCATFAIAFLMYKLATTLDSSMLLVRKARSNIYPNPGFMKQLRAY